MDNRKFNDVVDGIASAEKDVDKVLDAAKLERHEREPRYLTASQKMELIIIAMVIFGMLSFLSLFFLPILIH